MVLLMEENNTFQQNTWRVNILLEIIYSCIDFLFVNSSDFPPVWIVIIALRVSICCKVP